MSLFTQEEIDQLMKGGNGVAKKIWLHSWTSEEFPIPDHCDEKKINTFIRLCFERAQWKELPTSEPLENLVGKDIVQNLNFTKNHKTNPQLQQPPPPQVPKHTAQPINPQPKQPTTRFEPSAGHVSRSESSQWDPFGQSNAVVNAGVGSPLIQPSPPGPAPVHGVLPSGPGHNPFSAFTFPTTSPENNNNNNTIFPNPTTTPVDPHTLFKSTPVTTQPTVAQPYYPGTPITDSSVVYSYRIVSPYGVNPSWVPPITVQPQVTVTQTGPDAFSGLLPGFSTKSPSSTAVNPIK